MHEEAECGAAQRDPVRLLVIRTVLLLYQRERSGSEGRAAFTRRPILSLSSDETKKKELFYLRSALGWAAGPCVGRMHA